MNNLSTGTMIYMWIFALAASILLGYWAGKVGVRNGRSFGACFLLGFLLGLIGVLIVYVIGQTRGTRTIPNRASHETGPETEQEERRFKVCPFCEKLIPCAAEYCQYCGEGIPTGGNGDRTNLS